MNITLPDGASIELEDNSTILDAAKKISMLKKSLTALLKKQ